MKKSNMMGVAMLAMGALVLCSMPLFAVENSPQPILHQPVAFGAGHIITGEAPSTFNLHLIEPPRRIPMPRVAPATDPVLQRTGDQSGEFNLVYQVMGVGNGFPGYSVPDAPPDTTMAVGDTEIVQWVNVSYADFNKSTGAIIPLNGQDSTLGNYIWQTLLPGSACANNNDGDIIVKFDRAAHRWIMAQNVFNGPPYYVCVAISQTATFSDNRWYAYEYGVVNNGFPDYPKWGVWSTGGQSDGYYQTWNNFGPGGSGFVGAVFCGYDRAKMLTGNPNAEQICFQGQGAPNYDYSVLPADRDSPTPPPINQDEFFIGSLGIIDNSHLSGYSMHITDWATGQATITGLGDSQLIPIATLTGACDGAFGGDCIPEPGGNFVDSLGDRVMYRFAYWDDTALPNFTRTPPNPLHVQHWYVNATVWNTSVSANDVRWMEFNAPMQTVPVTSLTVFQQGTYAGTTGDANHRWMASLTRDNVDDVLLGYSESNSTTLFPSIAVAGRVVTDPAGTLSPEVFVITGAGSQVDTDDRWGDYSTMEIDPTDNCTFFYTQEYYMTTASFDWSTNISSWKFPNCQ